MKYKKLKEEEEAPLIVSEPTMDYNIVIPVKIPTMGGYSLEELTNRLTMFANQLVLQNKNEKYGEENDVERKKYSKKLQFLRSNRKNIPDQNEIVNDPRLAYLLNK